MKFNKNSLILVLLAFSALPLCAQKVDENELKTTGSDNIVFINYTGPHSKIDSLSSIKKIGSDMGDVIKANKEESSKAGYSQKYSVIHAIDKNEKGKLDADIILIGKDATVDHITNLRHIIASYLQASYGYSESDAETIAVFVTVYNAVYRQNLTQFQNKYKNIVTKNLTKNECGLSVSYKDWPGSSQIVIPLYDVNGGISTIDTSVISDTEVVKHMQEDDGKNIDDRKQMVDIKEREADKAQKEAQDAKKQATQEKQKLTEEKKKTEEAKKEAEDAKKKAEENPDDKKAQEEAEEAEKAYEEQKQIEKEQEETVREYEETARDSQTRADKKNDEAQTERKTIASDQQEVIQKEIENARAPSAYAIRLTDESNLLSGLVKVNTETGEVIQASPVTYIRNRTMFQANDSFIAIAGENSGLGAVKLVLLSPETMEISKESEEIVAEESVLVQDNGEYYCIIQNGEDWVVGKYDSDLNLKLKSTATANQSTPMTITSDYVIVSAPNGYVRILKKSDLTEVASSSAGYFYSAPSSADAK